MPLTDKQLDYIFTRQMTNHNAAICGRITHNEWQRPCPARSIIVSGKLRIHDHCNYACEFLDNVRLFHHDIQLVKSFDSIIERAKKECPDEPTDKS